MAKKTSRSVCADCGEIQRLRDRFKLKTRAMLLDFLGIGRSRSSLPCKRVTEQAADLSPGTVSKILDGKRVDVSSLQQFAKPFGVDYRDLIATDRSDDSAAKVQAASSTELARASDCKKILFVDDESNAWLLDAYRFAVVPRDPALYYATRGEVDLAASKLVRVKDVLDIPGNADLPNWFRGLPAMQPTQFRFSELADTRAKTQHLKRQYELRVKPDVLEEVSDAGDWIAAVVGFHNAFKEPDWFTVLKYFDVDHLSEQLRIGPLMKSARNVRVVVSVGEPVGTEDELNPEALASEAEGHGYSIALSGLRKGQEIHWDWDWG